MRQILTVCLILAGLLLSAPAAPQGAEPAAPPLTIDEVLSPVHRTAFRLPSYYWLPGDQILLFDSGKPGAERGLERYDPATGARTPLLADPAAALKGLNELLTAGGGTAEEHLGEPLEMDAAAKRALYLIADDVFLQDLATGAFRRITRTPAAEAEPHFSPDGRWVAYHREHNLYVTRLADGKEYALTRDGRDTLLNGTLSWVYWEEIFGREDLGYWWSPDSTAMVYLKSDESKVSVSYFPDYEPATPAVHRQRYPKAGETNPSVSVWLAEVPGGKARRIAFADPELEYVVRVHWLPHGRSVAVQTMNRAQNRLKLWLVDRRRATARVIFTEESPTVVSVHDDLAFTADGARFVWASERDGRNRLYLYEISGKLVRALTPENLLVRASSGVAWVRGGLCALDEAGGWIYYTATDGAPIAPALFRSPLAGGAAERLTREPGSHRVGFSPSRQYFFDEHSSMSRPPGLTLHRADGEAVRVVAAPAADHAAKLGLLCPEFLTIPAEDGFALPAQILKPAALEPGRRYPVILYVYGGPNAPVVGDRWGRDLLMNNLLVQRGYIWMAVDNRSASGLGKALEDTVHHKLMSGGEVADIVAAVRWIKRQPWADPDRVGVWGWSGGGTFTVQLMSQSQEFRAGIAVAGVYDFRYYDSVWAEHLLGLPKDNPEGYKAGAPATWAKNLHGRLFLVHGLADDNVHPQNAWRLTDELIAAKIPFDLMVYPRQGHGIRAPASYRHLMTALLDFWERWLKGENGEQ